MNKNTLHTEYMSLLFLTRKTKKKEANKMARVFFINSMKNLKLKIYNLIVKRHLHRFSHRENILCVIRKITL